MHLRMNYIYVYNYLYIYPGVHVSKSLVVPPPAQAEPDALLAPPVIPIQLVCPLLCSIRSPLSVRRMLPNLLQASRRLR